MSASEISQNVATAGLFYVVLKAMMNTKGLEAELGFYGAYHSNPWNQLIHFIFIPCIWWSICVFTCYVPFFPLRALGLGSLGGHRITWGTAQLVIYSAFYVSLHPVAGGLTSLLLLLFYLQASSAVSVEQARVAVAKSKGKADKKMTWFTFAFILHALSWYMQIHPGHKVLEGVKPALVDSLGQALGVAPMFAFLEGVWFAGLLPDMKGRVLVLVAENRAAMCAAGKVMPWC